MTTPTESSPEEAAGREAGRLAAAGRAFTPAEVAELQVLLGPAQQPASDGAAA